MVFQIFAFFSCHIDKGGEKFVWGLIVSHPTFRMRYHKTTFVPSLKGAGGGDGGESDVHRV